ncbi:MAG: urease accessory protein UreD [Cyclobacteriaceae bacterium]|nr:urease accessory protein UreD [Cyclobacteriaceae bacterium]
MQTIASDIGAITSKGGLNHCKMHFSVAHQNGRTYLKQAYCTPPFRVVDITEDKRSPLAYLMTMSSSPGILDYDRHDIRILAESHTRTIVQNQSYHRVFQNSNGATLSLELQLQENSTLSYIQHPVVPHQKSAFKAINKIQLAEGTELLFGEIITCGRKLSGEVFKFNHFQSLTEIFFKERLSLKDNILIQPEKIDLAGIGQLEGFTHQGTLYYINLRSNDCQIAYERATEILTAEEDIEFGMSKPLNQALVVRMLANGGEQVLNAFRKLEEQLIINPN